MKEAKKTTVRKTPVSPIIFHDRCVACGTCMQFCKNDVMEMDADGKPLITSPWNCPAGCRTCARLCPTGAATFQDEEHFITYLQKRLSSTKPPPYPAEAFRCNDKHCP